MICSGYFSIRIDHLTLIFFILAAMSACSERGSKQAGNGDHLNRLALAASPYLQEHADNPVDWYEWGPEALMKAEKENKPLLISIGYASCHWCHVMERESFMDTSVARFMNENFVSIKIDREERPDIDQIYLNAAQLISGTAGWPLNAFALPDGKPFYAATYFPKDQWLNVLRQTSTAFRNDHDQVVEQAKAVAEGIQTFDEILLPAKNGFTANKNAYQDIFLNWQGYVDVKAGGLKGAPKFPIPGNWEFLLQYHYLTGSAKALELLVTTLDQMAMGGIYDQIDGGFARYSIDENWKVPHFEKMLYDNGQLVSLYAHAYQKTQKPLYAEVVHETLAFIEREMTAPGGGFYSSINADSEDEEGKFYVWTKAEMTSVLDPKHANLLIDYYRVSEPGNWESGKNILHRKVSLEGFAEANGLTFEVMRSIVEEGERSLFQARNERVHPAVDDKILTSWNALMLKGYVDAYLATGESRYIKVALQNAGFLEKNMIRQDGRLWRSYKDGEAGIDAFLEDYALLARAFMQLYQATFDVHWLELSRTLADFVIAHFRDPVGGLFYYTADDSENLIARKMELTDHVIPASNSVLAYVLYCLGEFYYNEAYSGMSRTMLSIVTREVLSTGPYYSNWASLMGMMTYQPQEVAIMGDQALERCLEIQKHYLPVALFMGGSKENLPLLQNKHVEKRTIIYVCRNKVCRLPVEDLGKAMEQLK